MTPLHWDILLMILGCATIVLGFVATYKRKPIWHRIRTGAIYAWMWCYTQRQTAADKDDNSRPGE